MRTRSIFLRAGAPLLAAALSAGALAGCASSSATSADVNPATGCAVPTDFLDVPAQKIAGSTSDFDLTSFDGTTIRIHWFPLSASGSTVPKAGAPTVLMGPGWGESGATDTASTGIFGSLSIAALRNAGYNVATWDPRGFGRSKGTIEIDSPTTEARDTSAIISWVSRQKGVETDSAGDPRMGMVGGSYGGGIQFVTAATDCRIDAIAPTIAWHSLATSLARNSTPKTGWSGILMSVSGGRSLDPKITAANTQAMEHGTTSKESEEFFASRGPASLLSKVTVPTLILQGTVDGLFPLSEGAANYEVLKKQGTTVSMVWFCGGHGSCLTNPGRSVDVGAYSITWMDRWVKGDKSAAIVEGFRFVDQDGTLYEASTFPPPAGPTVRGSGMGSLEFTDQGGSGPATADTTRAGASTVDVVALAVTPAKASNAVDVDVAFTAPAVVLGAPSLTMTYRGSGPKGDRPARVFAQLVDPATGLVVDNQVTPIPVMLDGNEHTLTLPLEMVAFSAASGSHLVLQITPTTVAYARGVLGGSIDLKKISIAMPTTTGVTVVTKGS